MLILKVLMIVFAAILGGSRLICLVSPTTSRRMMTAVIQNRLIMLIMGLFMAIFGGFLFWSARLAMHPDHGNLPLHLAVWGYLVGAVATVGGLFILISPGSFARFLTFVRGLGDTATRAVMFLGLLVGLAVLYVAIWIY